MGRIRRNALAVAAAFVSSTIAPSLARAHDSDERTAARCGGIHSLFDPLPDECLGPIDTDRPHQTDTPHVVPAGHAQFEFGLAMIELGGPVSRAPGTPGPSTKPRLVFFENMYKFGVLSNVDLQLIVAHAAYDTAKRAFDPAGPITLRAKLNVLEEDGIIPALTFVPAFSIPMSPGDVASGGTSLFVGWELPLSFDLEVNVGALVTAGRTGVSPLLATALTHPVVGPLRAFVEGVVIGQDGSLGTGLLLNLGRDWQIDGGSYIGLAGDRAVATPYLGLSFRR